MVELATTVLFYLPAAVLLGWIQRRIVGPSRGDF
jgi:hypothetical protein